jgi:hypothetical protein
MTTTEAVATPSKQAVTERGATLRDRTEHEVDEALRALALNCGQLTKTCEQLAEGGISIHRDTLRKWRETSFPRRYHAIRKDLGRDIGEEIAGRAFERALQADDAARQYIQEAIKKLSKVPAEHLAKNAHSLAQAMGISVEKAQTLGNEPNQIIETRSVDENIRVLERYGVLKRADSAIDAQVVDEQDAA